MNFPVFQCLWVVFKLGRWPQHGEGGETGQKASNLIHRPANVAIDPAFRHFDPLGPDVP